MNYLMEILAFYNWLETNPQPASTIALWHALMHINNKCGWKTWFTVAIATLELKTGLSRKTVQNSRNQLVQSGLIEYRKRSGNQSGEYQLKSLCIVDFTHNASHNTTHNTSHNASHNTTHNASPLDKQYNTKQNSSNSAREPDFASAIDIAANGEALDQIEAECRRIGMGWAPSDLDIANALYADYDLGWILQAVRTASEGKEQTWRYIKGILRRYKEQGGIDSGNRRDHQGSDGQRRGGASQPATHDWGELGITL